jgi:hypothetical protein
MTRAHLLPTFLGLLLAASALANPPAPSFTIFGSVRGEDGRPLSSGEGILIVNTAAGEVARGPTDTTLGKGINYALQLPMDSSTSDDLYKSTASDVNVLFTVQVVIGGKTYVPLAVAGRKLDTNIPGMRERFDFILGVDTDNDGLPDAWEQGLIDANVHSGLLHISDVNPNDDADGDGLTNYQEFLIGTYALDAKEGIFLDILGMSNGVAHLQFLTARGRTYTIKSSTDLKTWVDQSISTESSGANANPYFIATDSDYVDFYAPGLAAQPARFFKLYVE